MRLGRILDRAVQIAGSKTSTVFAERIRTWADSADRIARLAGAIGARLYERSEAVAILALNSDHYFELIHATFRAGGAIDPLNIRFAIPELVWCLNDSRARTLFVDDAHLDHARELQAMATPVEHWVYMGEGPLPKGFVDFEQLIAESDPAPDANLRGEELAAILYTGGTTGRPKGVMASCRALYWAALVAQTTGLRKEGGSTLYTSPMFHLSGAMQTLIGTMIGGVHIFLPRFDAAEALKLVEAYRPTTLTVAPVMVRMLLDHPDFTRRDLSSLQVLVYGMSPMPEDLLRRSLTELPHVGFLQAYGQTETMGGVTYLLPAEHDPDHSPALLGSCGRANYVSEIKVAGADGTELPRGEVGEIWVRTPTAMSGYLNLPEESIRVLHDGWIRTGDAGRMDGSGYLFIADRLKDMIITGGENVYSAEVENALSSHPDVQMCAVIGVPDDRWGERIHAVITRRPGALVTEEMLMLHCRSLIAGYKTPRSIELRDDPLPLTAAGKVQKSALRQPHWQGRARAVN